ncbi:protein SPIRAL1-like 1 [Ricinus communis]|uniref:SP1L, putative n=1 Tax=Ricinus communis TaxID=3988 RepID=B9RLL8_RICCO|nr:protein SPIRAL1-like 1 [Ricinus communis]XP_015572097.1 protein SPIRAL1-like 1 [Ricinus communis]EEF47743.1 SP1L, putative [Ricinus communis]|eukprot:XP_002514637.1 protein SPIRAL1-like 1 [Ricinus communis]
MGRGVSSGGGQSSLGYLFGSGEAPKPTNNNTVEAAPAPVPASQNTGPVASNAPAQKPASPAEVNKQIPAGVPATATNNYFRADGQNCGNFLTDRPTTKVHAAPGGGSSLDYLFGGSGK